MHARSRILLKLSGQVFLDKKTGCIDGSLASSIVDQIKTLSTEHQFGIVVGGGNLFRGNQQGKILRLTPWSAHTSGMLATLINGVILRDMMHRAGIPTTLVSAVYCPEVAEPISQQTIDNRLRNGDCILFAGGTGNPFFTTDTNAVLRAVEIGAGQLWKCTSIDGVYDDDPVKNPTAKKLQKVSFQQALDMKLAIMDATAFTLANEHGLLIRIINVFEENALKRASQEAQFGSVIQR